MKRLVGALAFVGALAAAAPSAQAQEIQLRGPLAGASACRRCVLYRDGRFSITPTFGITLQDPFDRVLMAGVQLNYHFNDVIAVGVWGGYSVVHIDTALTSAITDRLRGLTGENQISTPNIPDGSRFPQQIGRLEWVAAPQISAIPLRGKIALFENIFIDTDLYVFAGVAFAGVSERTNFDSDNNPSNISVADNQVARTSRVAIAPTFGVGLNFYFNRFVSLSIEYRAFPFAWNQSGTDESSTEARCGADGMQPCNGFPDYQVSATGRFNIDDHDRSFAFNQMVNFGINIFLPTAPRISP